MPRINPTISNESMEIYNGIKERNDRGKFVSDAIKEKHDREQGTSLEQRVTELERIVKELEGRG